MIRSGRVIVSAGVCGVIQDASGREFYFNVTDSEWNGALPKIGDRVRFTKDPDYKSTDVALLIAPETITTHKKTA